MRAYFEDVTTATTAGSTTLPNDFKLVSLTCLDDTNSITVSVVEEIDTNSAGSSVLGITDQAREINFRNIPDFVKVKTVYWQSSAATPSLRIVGYIS